MQALLGDWASCTVTNSQDTTGLGWWSYVEMQGKNNQRYIILSGYRVGENQTIDFGSNNTYNQQYHILHQQGHHSPDPRDQFVDNLIQRIQDWHTNHKAVLICLDANENPQQPNATSIHRIFTETDLVNLHTH